MFTIESYRAYLQTREDSPSLSPAAEVSDTDEDFRLKLSLTKHLSLAGGSFAGFAEPVASDPVTVFQYLETVDARENYFSLSDFLNLPIRELDLSSNAITDEVMQETLHTLTATGGAGDAAGASSARDTPASPLKPLQTSLKSLSLCFNGLTQLDALRAVVEQFPNLELLDISGNSLRPGGSDTSNDLPGPPSPLAELVMDSHPVSEEILSALGKAFPAIRTLTVRYSNLTPAVVPSFAEFVGLETLDVSGNTALRSLHSFETLLANNGCPCLRRLVCHDVLQAAARTLPRQYWQLGEGNRIIAQCGTSVPVPGALRTVLVEMRSSPGSLDFAPDPAVMQKTDKLPGSTNSASAPVSRTLVLGSGLSHPDIVRDATLLTDAELTLLDSRNPSVSCGIRTEIAKEACLAGGVDLSQETSSKAVKISEFGRALRKALRTTIRETATSRLRTKSALSSLAPGIRADASVGRRMQSARRHFVLADGLDPISLFISRFRDEHSQNTIITAALATVDAQERGRAVRKSERVSSPNPPALNRPASVGSRTGRRVIDMIDGPGEPLVMTLDERTRAEGSHTRQLEEQSSTFLTAAPVDAYDAAKENCEGDLTNTAINPPSQEIIKGFSYSRSPQRSPRKSLTSPRKSMGVRAGSRDSRSPSPGGGKSVFDDSLLTARIAQSLAMITGPTTVEDLLSSPRRSRKGIVETLPGSRKASISELYASLAFALEHPAVGYHNISDEELREALKCDLFPEGLQQDPWEDEALDLAPSALSLPAPRASVGGASSIDKSRLSARPSVRNTELGRSSLSQAGPDTIVRRGG